MYSFYKQYVYLTKILEDFGKTCKSCGKNLKERSKLPKKWTNMLKYSLCNVQRLCDYHFVFVYSKFGFYVQISAYFKSHHKFHGYFVKTTGFIRGSRSIGGA